MPYSISNETYERMKEKQKNRKQTGKRPVTKANKLYNSRTEKRLRDLEEKILEQV
ncbi:hypothetical protein [Halobacillus litoralis]|uniref:hypothetical protein n=1 Tax=Halobacillus litoralis TaxID=45668 RepID=UPI0013E8D1D7|nr:hypothetical protein [Halobacillus litoralis]